MTKLRAIPAVLIVAALGLMAPDGAWAASFTNSTAGSVDASVGTRAVSVTTSAIPAGQIVTDVNMVVDFHKIDGPNCAAPGAGNSFASETSMSLKSPAGTVVNLVFDQTPGPASYASGANAPRVLVTFDDSATDLVGTTAGGTPISGVFRPAEPLAWFFGESPQGTWTFTFGDDVGGDALCFYSFTLTLGTQDAGAQIRVGSVSTTRIPSGWTLDGSAMTNTRAKLLSSANFGLYGTVARSISITDTTGTIDQTLLSKFDVFFIGWLLDTAPNALTTNELNELEAWVSGGGTLIAVCNDPTHDATCDRFGYPVASSSTSPLLPTAAGVNHPLFDGPFGVVPDTPMVGAQGYFTTTSGATVLAQDSSPSPLPAIMERKLGAGRLILHVNVDALGNFFMTPGDAIANNNEIFLANLFAYAGPNRPTANDFDGDGEGDILWRNTSTTAVLVWLMDGFAKKGAGSPGGVPLAWDMAGTGDFNRDGRVDVLWRRNTTGANYVWFMDGTSKLATSGSISSAPPQWVVKGVTDYNGDGAADILWYNTNTGVTLIWQMNGRITQDAMGIGQAPLQWQIEY